MLDGQGGMSGSDAIGTMPPRMCGLVTANRDFLGRCGAFGGRSKDWIR